MQKEQGTKRHAENTKKYHGWKSNGEQLWVWTGNIRHVRLVAKGIKKLTLYYFLVVISMGGEQTKKPRRLKKRHGRKMMGMIDSLSIYPFETSEEARTFYQFQAHSSSLPSFASFALLQTPHSLIWLCLKWVGYGFRSNWCLRYTMVTWYQQSRHLSRVKARAANTYLLPTQKN